MPEAVPIFSVEADGQMYNQTNEFVYLGRNVNHNADLSIKVDRRIPNTWCSFRKYTLGLYDRPSASPELKIQMRRAEVFETMLYDFVTWSLRACHYDKLRQAHHSPLTRCFGWRKNSRTPHPPPDLLSGHPHKDGKGEHRGDNAQEAGPVRGICGANGEHETAEVCAVRRTGGRRGLRGGEWKRVDDASPGRPHSFRDQRRPVNDCSLRRGEVVQYGGTRGGTFHGEMDRYRESEGWTTLCSSISERDGKDQGEDGPKQVVCLCWFTRHR